MTAGPDPGFGLLDVGRLGRPVKKMIGGIEGWKDEGFALEAIEPATD